MKSFASEKSSVGKKKTPRVHPQGFCILEEQTEALRAKG